MVRYENNRLAIFGGCFDPVHLGHLLIAEKAREEFLLDKVLFIPAGRPPHKKKLYASSSHRINMVRLAIEGNKYFQDSDIEVSKKSYSYSLDTVLEVSRLYPEKEIFMIIGEDSLDELNTWYRYEELAGKVFFIVARRRIDFKKNIVPGIIKYGYIDSPYVDISSSYIRRELSEKKTARYLVPEKVLAYIAKENLYGT